MKKKMLAALAAFMLLTATSALSACGSVVTNTESTNISTTGTEITGTTNTEDSAPAQTAEVSTAEGELFTDRDLAQTADLKGAKAVTVSDGEKVNIIEAGVYVLSGSAKNAQVIVNAGDEDKVQLVLDGISIVNTDKPCITVENADKVFLTSAEGSENALTVSGTFSEEEDAVVFSRDDLVLNGRGTVTVSSTDDGIRSNDDLKMTGGTWKVTASGTAMKAHEGLYVYDGSYEFTAGSDGLHAEDQEDDTTGCIVIEGGSFTIKAGDDAIHATTTATINGGTFVIGAAEGIEATQVIINGGTVNIAATDDGINAGRKSSALSVKLEINGGRITIAMGAGDTDAVDSNGDLVITGGTIDITAQSPFDYDGNCSYTGGTIIINGSEVNSVPNQMMGGGQRGGQKGGRRR